jgi:hypothetical protein
MRRRQVMAPKSPVPLELQRYRWDDWVTADEQARAPRSEGGWEQLDDLATRRWMDASFNWKLERGLSRTTGLRTVRRVPQ